MLFVFISRLVPIIGFLHSNIYCPDEFQGDGICDLGCMTLECNFDSSATSSKSLAILLNSDCLDECLRSNCTIDLLENNECDEKCNIQACGWDRGQCGYCAPGCSLALLKNNEKDEACNSKFCFYDNNQFGWCALDCFYEDLYSNEPKSSCNVSDCNFQNGIALSGYSPNTCNKNLLENGHCDEICNKAEFNYDNKKCLCADECFDEDLASTNCSWSNPCMNQDCNYLDGKCPVCSSKCLISNIGDGICQEDCNNIDCDYDGGDCGCAPNCESKYIKGEWEMQGECNSFCLVESCLFNYKVCNDTKNISLALIYSVIYEDYSNNFKFDANSSCLDELMHSLPSNSSFNTSSPCENINCDMCDSLKSECFKFKDECLFESELKNYNFRGESISDSISIDKFASSIKELNTIVGSNIYFIKEGSYSRQSPLTFYVNKELSLYEAMIMSIAPYVKINIEAGDHNLTINNYFYETRDIYEFENAPLFKDLEFTQYTLIIEGSNAKTTKVIFLDEISFKSNFYKTIIRNITFDGHLLINNNCTIDKCYYYPNFIQSGDTKFTDRFELIQIEFKSYYDYESGKFKTVIFEFDNETFIENVHFFNFQQQSPGFITTSSSLTIKNTIFERIQTVNDMYVIHCNCDEKYGPEICSKFIIKLSNVQVIDLNYGYEHIEDMEQQGFLSVESLGDVLIEKTEFKYNMAISCSDCSESSLIEFKNILGTIKIIDCVFESIYVRTLIKIDSSEIYYSDDFINKYDKYGRLSVYYMDHLLIKNTEFLNIYAQDGIIVYLMKIIKQNIKITNCSFTNIAAMKYGLIKIDGQDSLTNTENEGYWSYQVVETGVNNSRVQVFYSPRFAILQNLNVQNIKSGPYVFYFTRYPNILIQNVNINDVNETDTDDPYTYSIAYFSDSKKYLSMYPDESLVKTTSLISVFYAFDINSIEFNNVTVNKITSTSFDFCAFYIETAVANASFTKVSLSNISGYTFIGIALYLRTIGEIFINYLKFTELTNSYENLVTISKTLNVSINKAILENVVTNFSAAFSIVGVESLTISDFYVNKLDSYDSKGSLFYFNLGSTPNFLNISNITVHNSKNHIGRGLFIFLDSVSSLSSFNLNFTNIFLKDCSVEDSFLYFEFNLFFNLANINNLIIENSKSNKGGIITDLHTKGTLKLDNFVSNNNEAFYCGVVCKYTSTKQLLSIFNSVIKNSICSAEIFLINGITGTIVEINNLIIFNTTADNSAISVFSAQLLGNIINIYDSFLQYGIILSIGKLNLSELTFKNNTGQAVYMQSSSFSCVRCTFNMLSRTVLNLYQESTLNINDSNFSEIDSTDHDFLYITNMLTKFSIFTNCVFTNSYSQKGQFEIDKANLKFINCTIKDNTSDGGFCIKSGASNLTVSGSKFINQGYTYIEATVSSFIIIDSSEFYGNLAKIEGISSDLARNRQILSQKNLKSLSGAVYAIDSYLEISDSTFKELYGIYGAAIYTESTPTKISSSIFTNCATSNQESGVVYINNENSYIESSKFSSSLTESSLLFAQSIKTLNITLCTFSNNNSTEGAGIYIEECDCTIKKSLFMNNYASDNGGGIYSDDSSLKVENSSFLFNKAEKNGGGILFDISPNANPLLLFTGINYFKFNSAINGSGGAVNWEGNIPEIRGFNYYLNNSAVYGPDNSSYPVQLVFQSQRLLSDINNFRPGGEYKESLNVCYGDIFNQIIKTSDFDIESDATLTIDKNSSLSGTTTFKAESGCFNLTGFIIKGKPGTEITLNLKSNLISEHADKYENDIISDFVSISVGLRLCTYGEAISNNECNSCAPSKYLIEPSNDCLSCPTGAECLGGYLVLPKSGYWKLDKYSDQIYECPYSLACLGSMNVSDNIQAEDLDINKADVDFTGTCATGYYGNMCASCEIGYSKSTNGQCSKCPDQTSNALIMVGFLILIISVAYVMISSTLKSVFSTKSLHSIYIKIFTNYLQIVFLTTELNLNWPSYVLELFSVQRSAASASDQVYSIDCLFSDKSSKNTDDIYYYKVLLATLLPPIVWIISLLVWIFISFYKESYHYLKKELFTTMIILFFLIHPNIIKTIFSSFSCREIKNNGYWLVNDLQIKCWTASHIRTLMTISVPGVILWGFGVPFMVLIIMIKRFRFLNRDTNKVIFGFINNGYKQKKFFWEFVILYRKILIISISVFMSTVSNTIQALTIVILLICALYFQYSQHPYVYKQLNYMEIEALLTATLTLYCGLYYLSNELNEYIKTALFILILIGNAYFIIYWIYFMAKAIIDILVKVFPVLKKVLKKGDYFDKSLFEKSLQNEGVYFDKIDGEKKFTLFKPVLSKLHVELENITNMNELYKISMNQK